MGDGLPRSGRGLERVQVPEVIYRCFHCGFTFPAPENYKVHLLTVHPEGELAKSVKRQLARPETTKSGKTK